MAQVANPAMPLPRLLLLVVFWLNCVPAFGQPIDLLPAELKGAIQPQLALAPNGRLHVVFGRGTDIYHTSSADGRVFSPPVKVGSLEKLALGMRRGPRVTATDARVLVTAISHADGNVHAWTSEDTGATWKEGAGLNAVPNSAREGLQSLAGDGRGLVTAVWLDLRGKGMEIYGRISRDGGQTWAADLSIYQSPDGHVCQCCVPNVAISAKGTIAAMWRNALGGSRDLYLSTSEDGRNFSPAQKLGSDTWKLNACPMDGGSLAFNSAGKWHTVWRRESALFSSDAAETEAPITQEGRQPVTASLGETFFTTWEVKGGLMLQRGRDRAVRIAEGATSPSIVAGTKTGFIAWEATLNGAKTILVQRLE
jgi:hypothetical protein